MIINKRNDKRKYKEETTTNVFFNLKFYDFWTLKKNIKVPLNRVIIATWQVLPG